MPFDANYWITTFSNITSGILTWLPKLLGAVILLLFGWVIARIVQFIMSGFLRRLGLDRLADRAGAARFLTSAGFDPSVSHLFARLIYWLILLVFILAAAESLGLPGMAETFSGLLAYLPNVFAAALILLFGGLIARIAGEAVGALGAFADTSTGSFVGRAVRYILLAFTIILAVEQLNVETTLLVTISIVLVSAAALAIAVAFGFGSRELARNIMAGFYAKDEFKTGDVLNVRGHSGKLVSIGSVKSVIETKVGRVTLPNLALTEEDVTVVSGETDK